MRKRLDLFSPDDDRYVWWAEDNERVLAACFLAAMSE